MTKLDKLKALAAAGPVEMYVTFGDVTKLLATPNLMQINPADLAALLEVVEEMHMALLPAALYAEGPPGDLSRLAVAAFDNWNREE
jgi:hypothetical protein